jgi:hypothetical protein
MKKAPQLRGFFGVFVNALSNLIGPEILLKIEDLFLHVIAFQQCEDGIFHVLTDHTVL